jgi:hypothetical protein
MPVGFFDDVVADNLARGIDLRKVMEERVQAADKDLKTLFAEVDLLAGLSEEELAALEAEEAELEEEALQLAYLTKVALLKTAAEKQADKHSDVSERGVDSNSVSNNSDDTLSAFALEADAVISGAYYFGNEGNAADIDGDAATKAATNSIIESLSRNVRLAFEEKRQLEQLKELQLVEAKQNVVAIDEVDIDSFFDSYYTGHFS